MLKSYYGIADVSKCTIIVEKSRFLCFAFPIFSKTDVINILKRMRNEYHDATHICYAYVLTDEGVQERYFDDGEPSGTAGRPICAVIKKKNLMNVMVVVVRYFGKIKLGASGLTRTYGACASKVLELASEHKYIHAKRLGMMFNSNEYFKYIHIFNNPMIKIKHERFEEQMCIVDIAVASQDVDTVVNMLRNIDRTIDLDISDFYL